MINLYFKNGAILLYNVNDWSTLREQFRIVGEIVGNSLQVPSLPIKISPEEACLLVDKNIVTIQESPKEITKTDAEKRKLEQYETELLDAQTMEYKRARRDQLETVADQIMVKQNNDKTREEIISEELAKLTAVTRDNMIWPTNLSASTSAYENLKPVDINDILKLTTPVKKAVYSDLWHKGYYVTQGDKFGGHFLAYAGDPVCHHALFIVRCKDESERIFSMDLIGFGRLGSSVKKKSVWASLQDNKVSYISMSWLA
ncbi:unnamed protein product [Psylliodes chrysocephalus]|uniref:tRNA-intron lyase n=1 Tax=Psylliodes chrysocephalus TaxID=3402493 RepID=A0A9P0CN76_9CUCU|nr:unnamed protein product [Psylliodes chrysocephala]